MSIDYKEAVIENGSINGADLHLLLESVSSEIKTFKTWLDLNYKMLRRDKAQKAFERRARDLSSLLDRLQWSKFCLALPFAPGSIAYIVEESDNGEYVIREETVYAIHAHRDMADVYQVEFWLSGERTVTLRDYCETLFRYKNSAERRCERLNRGEIGPCLDDSSA